MSGTPEVAELCVGHDSTLREAIEQIDRNRRGVILVVDGERRLTDLLTDGDVRRAVLAGTDLETPVHSLRDRRAESPYVAPLAARIGTRPERLLAILERNGIRHLPLLDERERVCGVATLEELLPGRSLPVDAIVMAGGRGTRLRPLTESVPKPMLPVGDRPLLEHTLEKLRDAGIATVHITTHYRAEKITDHFGDGRRFGLDVRYVNEEELLGTAGALSLLDVTSDAVLVINGDVLTNVDFRAMHAFHREHAADLTVATRRYEVQIPYGVVECEGASVRRLREKPRRRFFVNAGIYLIEPSALGLVPRERPFHMTDLIDRLLAEKRPVVGFPVHEYWIDIGQLPEYTQAQRDVASGRLAR